MQATGEDNLYFEMDSKTDTGTDDVYDDIVGRSTTPVTTQSSSERGIYETENNQALSQVEIAVHANMAKVQRMLFILTFLVVVTFMISVATLVLVVDVIMTTPKNASTATQDCTAVQRRQNNEPFTEIKECESNPCFNGGACTDRVNGFNCSCPPGFAGDQCQTDINECESSPCLNNGTCNDRVSAFSCCCPVGFAGVRCEKAMRGLYYQMPAHSCKEIRDLGVSKGDGEYWIDPEKSGKPLRVYCDMTTDGGGWLLVSSVVTKGPTPHKVLVETSYRGISGDQMALTKDAMNELRTHLSFTQLRFHCSKLQGRTFHVTTAANKTGEAAVQYFSGQTNVQPASCGSFVKMENDNSMLSGVCERWGLKNGAYYVGKWGHERDQDRLHFYPAFVRSTYHWLIEPGGAYWLCDDHLVGVSTGDFWKVFVR